MNFSYCYYSNTNMALCLFCCHKVSWCISPSFIPLSSLYLLWFGYSLPTSSSGGWVATEGRRTRQCSLSHGIGGAAGRWAMGPACGLNGCPAYPGACAWSSIPQAPSEARCTQLGDSAGESSSPKLLQPLSTSLPTKDPRWYVGIQEKHTINLVAFPEH